MSNFSDFIGGGGSASQINEVVTLNNSADIVTLSDERVYLKGGVFETTLSTYPNAATSIADLGVTFNVTSQDTSPTGIAWDGTYFWVVGLTNYRVYKYNSAGVYQNVSFYVGSQTGSPLGITWDGTHLWLIGGTNVWKYNSSGTYQNVSFSTSSQGYMQDITWDGTHFWAVAYSGDAVYKYTASGTYTGVSFSVAGQETEPLGIEWDGTHFWVGGNITDRVYKYNASGVYQNQSFAQPAGVNRGIVWDGSSLRIMHVTSDTVYKFGLAIGVASVSNLGAQNYVRVV